MGKKIEVGDSVFFRGSATLSVVYRVEEKTKAGGMTLRHDPDARGSWGSVTPDNVVLVTPELRKFLAQLEEMTKKLSPKARKKLINLVFEQFVF